MSIDWQLFVTIGYDGGGAKSSITLFHMPCRTLAMNNVYTLYYPLLLPLGPKVWRYIVAGYLEWCSDIWRSLTPWYRAYLAIHDTCFKVTGSTSQYRILFPCDSLTWYTGLLFQYWITLKITIDVWASKTIRQCIRRWSLIESNICLSNSNQIQFRVEHYTYIAFLIDFRRPSYWYMAKCRIELCINCFTTKTRSNIC